MGQEQPSMMVAFMDQSLGFFAWSALSARRAGAATAMIESRAQAIHLDFIHVLRSLGLRVVTFAIGR